MTVVGGSELAWQQSMALRALHAEDATGRTVRHPVRKSQAGALEDTTGRDREASPGSKSQRYIGLIRAASLVRIFDEGMHRSQ